VVNAPDDAHWDQLIDTQDGAFRAKVFACNVGGATRAESVLNGLREIASTLGVGVGSGGNDSEIDRRIDRAWALVHDAARPCIRVSLLEQFLDELEDEPIGGLLALPLADTLKRGNGDQRVEATLDRTQLWRAQTPQMFRVDLLRRALSAALDATDEAQAIERLGYQPRLVVGDSANLKVTYATDLKLAALLLQESHS
jgi:2-C-methyl-D-erythritol 4-phosphate cytidylyltransferase